MCVQCLGDTEVYDSRPVEGRTAVRRKRRCLRCGAKFSTLERKA